ncbi:hypothetical protein MHY13_03610 [Corynebacterium sp. ACRPE]|uniref:hypothetical protein n=1 Tax=Corynebacterium sp. ACRPE TaxID=2918196 RepID=UPI001EF5B4FF|nr:hypothetical protein [Corynebacterium sp. ACRPE]MCG7467221.1 hypothetical protein [Corynebacterium sp. ACRPE]
MSTRPIEVCSAKQIWQEYEIDVRILIGGGQYGGGQWSVLNISREEAVTLRNKLNDFLEDGNQ